MRSVNKEFVMFCRFVRKLIIRDNPKHSLFHRLRMNPVKMLRTKRANLLLSNFSNHFIVSSWTSILLINEVIHTSKRPKTFFKMHRFKT